MEMKERLTRFRSFWIFPLLAFGLLAFSKHFEPDRTGAGLAGLIAAGACMWTILEYALHRYVFHPGSRDTTMKEMLSGSHLMHHSDPGNPDKVLVYPPFALALSGFIFMILLVLSSSLFTAAGLMIGIWSGFLCYELIHYRVHCTATRSGLMARLRRTHFHHHFADPGRCFGVTTPLWDFVFGTRRSN